MNEYDLLDSGDGRKLERFGAYTIARPCAQAVWNPSKPALWKTADASFTRKNGLEWHGREVLPKSWVVEIEGVLMKQGRLTSGTSVFFLRLATCGVGFERPSKTVLKRAVNHSTF